MTKTNPKCNRVRELRRVLGLTQAELAERAGVSRTAITAIEGSRLIPSVATALALAEVLGVSVEAAFGREKEGGPAIWAWQPPRLPHPHWEAEVGGQRWLYPAESTPSLAYLPDWACKTKVTAAGGGSLPTHTLVIASCDPAAGLMASLYEITTGLRLIILQRSSQQALQLLHEGKVHLAGIHYSTDEHPDLNAQLVRNQLGTEYELLHVVSWQEGVAAARNSRFRSARGAVKSHLKWVGREPGSVARQCLDRLLEGRCPRLLARNHRGVADAISLGWADAGVCVRLTGAEAGLSFYPVQEEHYELCIPRTFSHDLRVQALVKLVRSKSYGELLSELPGYNAQHTGAINAVV